MNCLDIKISEHGYKRLKKRNGWSKKTANRMIDRIYINGFRPEEIKGYKKIWLAYKAFQEDYDKEYVVYGDSVYIFKEGILITTLYIPNKTEIMRRYKNYA